MRYRTPPGVLLVLLCLVVATPAAAVPTGNDQIRTTQALEWVADHYESAAAENPGFYADTILALAIAPGYEDTIEDAASQLAEATEYYGEPGAVNAPALAKTVVALQLAGVDPNDVSGRDLLAELGDTIVREGPNTGRVGNSNDVYAAAYASLAFLVASIDEPTVVDWLAQQQCPNGAFSYNGTCQGDEEFFGVDPDTTVIAIHGLESRPDVANDAYPWLADQQDPETGAFVAYDVPNANSTGLGGLGLGLFDQPQDQARAQEFALGLQFGPDTNPGQRGGLRYQSGDARPDFFATVQGVLAAADEGLFSLFNRAIVPSNRFEDVPDTGLFTDDIGWLLHVGVTRGCDLAGDQPRFCPDEPITRGEMAAFLSRALALPPSDETEYTDVAADHLFSDDINKATHAGIPLGCNPPTEYCPDETVTRGEVATMLAAALELTESTDHGFSDVADNAPYAGDVELLVSAGITLGCNPPDNTNFCPEDTVPRDELAAFLHRAFIR